MGQKVKYWIVIENVLFLTSDGNIKTANGEDGDTGWFFL